MAKPDPNILSFIGKQLKNKALKVDLVADICILAYSTLDIVRARNLVLDAFDLTSDCSKPRSRQTCSIRKDLHRIFYYLKDFGCVVGEEIEYVNFIERKALYARLGAMRYGDLPINQPANLQRPALNTDDPERPEGSPHQQGNPIVQPVDNNLDMQPAQDNVAEQPAPDNAAVQPAPDNVAVQPAADNVAVQPAADNVAMQPAPDNAAVQPAQDNAAVQPAPDNAAVQPAPDKVAVQPASDNAAVQPAPDDVPVQPAPVLINRELIIQGRAEEPAQQQVVPREEEPRLNGQLPDLGLQALTVDQPTPAEEITEAPAPNLGEERPRFNPPIQIMVSTDQQNQDDAWISSLRVEVVGPSQHVYAPLLDPPSPAEPPVQAQGALDQPNAVAPTPIQAPEPQEKSKAPEPERSMWSSREGDLSDPNESTSSMENESLTSSDTSDEDNLPLSTFRPVPYNGPRGFRGPLGQDVLNPTAPTRRVEGRPPRSRPIEIPPPSRALPPCEEWTDEEPTSSDAEPTRSKRRRRRSNNRPK